MQMQCDCDISCILFGKETKIHADDCVAYLEFIRDPQNAERRRSNYFRPFFTNIDEEWIQRASDSFRLPEGLKTLSFDEPPTVHSPQRRWPLTREIPIIPLEWEPIKQKKHLYFIPDLHESPPLTFPRGDQMINAALLGKLTSLIFYLNADHHEPNPMLAHAACDHPRIVYYLATRCPELFYVVDQSGFTPVSRCAFLGKWDVVFHLLAKGFPISYDVVQFAMNAKNFKVAARLVRDFYLPVPPNGWMPIFNEIAGLDMSMFILRYAPPFIGALDYYSYRLLIHRRCLFVEKFKNRYFRTILNLPQDLLLVIYDYVSNQIDAGVVEFFAGCNVEFFKTAHPMRMGYIPDEEGPFFPLDFNAIRERMTEGWLFK